MAHCFDCIGVEFQLGLVDYARRTRPGLDIRLGDMRTIRLDHTADVLTCLGNSLSYVYDNQDIQAVFRTFTAHARSGTLLVLCCSVAPIERDAPQEAEVETGSGTAHVTISYEWDLRAQMNTMWRHRMFDSGEETRDVIHRRVLGPRELELYVTLAGFDVIQITDGIGAGTLNEPTAYTVARYR
ncbi:SAM-dependent methyltransferase [Streptomyces sp. NPDC057336]|uniref:SAM-dependent methyltransferase n=1 Tax=Streptomyces sp. NPDC057336 TaxID=3346102 RepID=UPI003626927C